jgi:hypothetical protein
MNSEHYSLLINSCDFNNDGTIDACEMYTCVVETENEWRYEYCPDYGQIYCDCPFEIPQCDGAWNCADIIYITEDFMMVYDTNGDDSINLGDMIEDEHLEILLEYCDTDNNGSVNFCEVHDCVVECENTWRDEYCPESTYLYCNNPYVCPECYAAWTCEDVAEKTECIMADWDSNNDG